MNLHWIFSQAIFSVNSGSVLVVLPDVTFGDICNLKYLIYNGRVEIATSDDLSGLQKACSFLNIKLRELPAVSSDTRKSILAISSSTIPDDSRSDFSSSSPKPISEETSDENIGDDEGKYIHGPPNGDHEDDGDDTTQISNSNGKNFATKTGSKFNIIHCRRFQCWIN